MKKLTTETNVTIGQRLLYLPTGLQCLSLGTWTIDGHGHIRLAIGGRDESGMIAWQTNLCDDFTGWYINNLKGFLYKN